MDLTIEERQRIDDLIRAFDDHGCGLGLDLQAQKLLRRLLEAVDSGARAVAELTHERDQLIVRLNNDA